MLGALAPACYYLLKNPKKKNIPCITLNEEVYIYIYIYIIIIMNIIIIFFFLGGGGGGSEAISRLGARVLGLALKPRVH